MQEFHSNSFARPQSPVSPQGQDWQSSSTVVRTNKTLIVKDRFSSNDSETALLRGQRFARTLVSGVTFSVASSDYLIAVTSLALAPSIGLPRPSLVGSGKTFIIKDEVGGAGTTTITVRSEGEENIDGSSTATLTSNYQSKRFYTDGANWFTI